MIKTKQQQLQQQQQKRGKASSNYPRQPQVCPFIIGAIKEDGG